MFNINRNPRYDGYQRGLASMIYKCFDNKYSNTQSRTGINSESKRPSLALKLEEELDKSITRNFEKRKVYSSLKDNTWGADLAIMQLIIKFNKVSRFLLCVVDIYCKYVWIFALKDKEIITITNAFQKISEELDNKQNSIWLDKGSEFYNRLMKSWLQDNDIETYSTHNEEKSNVAEKFIKNSKNIIYKYMISITKNMYMDKLGDMVIKYNNTYHSTIKMKPADVNKV